MNNKELKNLKEFIQQEEKGYDFNDYILNYIYDDEDIVNLDKEELKQYFEDLNEDFNITNQEVIYYSKAINYLQENDPSLNESLEIAKEYGYDIEKINSELLASLLKTREVENNWCKFLNNLNDYIDDNIEDE